MDESNQPSRKELIREAWLASIGILLVLTFVKHAGAVVPLIGAYAFTIAAAVQLYWPVYSIGRRGITRETLGLTAARWKEDVALVALLAVIVTVPFAIGHHFWQTEIFKHAFKLRMPNDFLNNVLVQVFIVALAEELYFRGYLQERLSRIWPPALRAPQTAAGLESEEPGRSSRPARKLFGVPFGRAILVAASVFALAHFVGEYRVDRLGPFFPALVFGLLRQRTGTIVGAILFHAYCNILGEVLWACYRP